MLAHVIGGTSEVGLRLPSDSPWLFFHNIVAYVRMPLFSMISGFVYAYRPIKPGHADRFYVGKVRRLLPPFVFASSAFAIVGTLLATKYQVALSDFWEIYVFSYAHFWFLQAIFVIFVIVSVTELLFRNHKTIAILTFFAISCVLFVNHSYTDISFFSIFKVFYLLPFFLTGLLLNRFSNRIPTAAGIAALAIGALWLAAFAIDFYGQDVYKIERRNLLGLGVGVLICGSLIILRFKSVALRFIGTFSFTIYLYHVFATAASRVFFENVGDVPTFARVATGLALGLAAPIVLELLLRNRGALSMIVLGQYRDRARPTALSQASAGDFSADPKASQARD